MTETNHPDMANVLAQLARITQLMEAQQTKLDALENNRIGTNSGASVRTPLGVGVARYRDEESQPEDDPLAMEFATDGNRPSAGLETSSRPSQQRHIQR